MVEERKSIVSTCDVGRSMVLVCAIIRNDQGCYEKVVLIKKNRPEWQAGKWNLPGGHIEDGETPVQAACREFMEETGVVIRQEDLMATGAITRNVAGGGIVHVFTIGLSREEALPTLGIRSNDERVSNMDISNAMGDSSISSIQIIPNLYYIIPKCLAILDDFVSPGQQLRKVSSTGKSKKEEEDLMA